jgi:hypothetical protein
VRRGTTAGSKDEKDYREAGKEYEALFLYNIGLILCYRIVAVHEAAARPQRSDSIDRGLNYGMDTNLTQPRDTHLRLHLHGSLTIGASCASPKLHRLMIKNLSFIRT